MKKLKQLLPILFLLSLAVQSQNKASVEKSIYGIQTGILGVWGYNESKLTNSIALRSEIGLDAGFRGGSNINTVFVLTPTITIEPRFYYNLKKRSKKGKSILKNSANFLTLEFFYVPNLFVISNTRNVSVANSLSIIPKWGIKRTIGKHFTYELGLGIGYYIDLDDSRFNDTVADLHIRFGYTF
ncbi:hypothetical protein [Lutibacter sp.]|uniref:hypothetical protein n=1 Tax=Lutibacter sp. TaxID=1925666 RepID=UPI0025C1F046|nr:hypothetical protein [Lutibacter sp.]MCF6182514.1 hypothetical protein [Lutibacter sp.]